MQAVQAGPFGIEHLRVADLPDPAPAPGEVLIATEAATINPADLGIVTGSAAPRFPAGAIAPFTPGWDLAGRVVSSGDGVDPGLAGARVVGFTIWFVTGSSRSPSAPARPTTGPGERLRPARAGPHSRWGYPAGKAPDPSKTRSQRGLSCTHLTHTAAAM